MEESDAYERRRRAQTVLGKATAAINKTKRVVVKRTEKQRYHVKSVIKRGIKKRAGKR